MAIETLGAALRQVKRLFADGVVAGHSDAQLLERFLSRGDAGAFEALVVRHGPMVQSVCRAILRDPHDAEDAFQATFLVLVKNGGAIRGRDALAGWLHQVAHRVAIRANATAARRRLLERQVGQMAAVASTNGPAVPDDLLPALHEEIARLPEKYRLAVVHCDLEGLTQAQAAGHLHWSKRTLQLRLAEGRARLKRRLARRGLAPDGATLGAVLLRDAQVAVPAAWLEATVRAAVTTANPLTTAVVVSAAAQQLSQEVFRFMLLQKLKSVSASLLAAGLIVWGASTALVSIGQEAPPPIPAVPPTAKTVVPQPKPGNVDLEGTYPVRGQVVDPNGKPVAGAGVYVRHLDQFGWTEIDPMAAKQKGRVAVTEANGRFHLEIDKTSSTVVFLPSFRNFGRPGWHKAQVAAAVPGFAPAWVNVEDLVKGSEATLRLVRDDVPVHGRVLNSEGRPVAGVVVRIRAIREVKDGLDLDALLSSGALDEDDMYKNSRQYGSVLGSTAPTWRADPAPNWPGGRNLWTTDADGRFEVRGIGRDRIARLDFRGGGVADGTIDVMARPAKTPPKVQPKASVPVTSLGRRAAFLGLYPQGTQLVGATFDYIASPSKPINGVVRLKGTGKPVEGAIVRVADAGTHTAVIARTDAAGRFRVEGVPKGEFYQLQVQSKPGIDSYLRYSSILDDTEGTKPIEELIEVSPGVVVIGRLIDKATGQAVLPADVDYHKTPGNVTTEEASLGFSWLDDGAFGLTVPPGPAIIGGTAAIDGKNDPYVCARLKPADRENGVNDRFADALIGLGYHTYRFINVPAGTGPVTVDLELTRGLSRPGRLTSPDGQPVVGAVAYGLSASQGSFLTLDASTFEVGGLEPGHPRRVVFMHKARKLIGTLVLKDEDMKLTTPLEVKLVPVGTITGRLVDDDGLPWRGATFSLWISDPDRPNVSGNPPVGNALWDYGETVTADNQGRFRIEEFVPGVETQMIIGTGVPHTLDRLEESEALRNLVLNPGEIRDLGDVKAQKVAQ